jgi:hypothetical protein
MFVLPWASEEEFWSFCFNLRFKVDGRRREIEEEREI